jgi:hypothetical protein
LSRDLPFTALQSETWARGERWPSNDTRELENEKLFSNNNKKRNVLFRVLLRCVLSKEEKKGGET